MKSQDHLHELIKSMSQNEKRCFKLFSSLQHTSKDKSYLLLFEAIDKMKVYDEGKLKANNKNAKFIKYFAQEKRYLFGRIMKSLRAYHSSNS